MAQRIKTRTELAGTLFLKQSEVMRLLAVTPREAKQIYMMADQLDDEKYGKYRTQPNKVTITSVCKVQRITLQTLQQLIKNEGALAQHPSINQ